MKTISKIIAFIIKSCILYYWIKFVNYNYNYGLTWYNQNIVIWIMGYLPFVTGFEKMISMIFAPIHEKIKSYNKNLQEELTPKTFKDLLKEKQQKESK